MKKNELTKMRATECGSYVAVLACGRYTKIRLIEKMRKRGEKMGYKAGFKSQA